MYVHCDFAKDGELANVPEEAEIVKLVFKLYLEGCSFIQSGSTWRQKALRQPQGKIIGLQAL